MLPPALGMKLLTAKSARERGPRDLIALLVLAVAVSQDVCVASAAQPLPAAAMAPSGAWRTISRDANMQFSDKDYAKAVEGYRAAIAELEKRDPGSESVLDLYLNLAETYRLRGDGLNARQILDKVGPTILARKCDDPLLPARYWRRRADFVIGLGDGRGYAAAYSKALRIASDNLPDEYRPIISDKLFFLRNVCTLNLFNYATPLALEMTRTVPASSIEADQISSALKDASLSAEKQVELQLSAKDGNPRDALLLLSHTAFDKSVVLYLVNRWLGGIKQPKASDYKLAETILNNMVASRGLEPSSPQNVKANYIAQLTLAKLCYLQGRAPEAVAHQNAARPLIAYKDKKVTDLLDNFAWYCFEQGAGRVGKEQFGPPTEQLFRAACDFQPLYFATGSRETTFNSLDKIALYKMNLARVLNSLGRVDESVLVMDSIPTVALQRQDEKFWFRYGLINCLIAQSQANHGAPDAAKARFAKVLTTTALIKNPVHSRDLKARMAECQRGAK